MASRQGLHVLAMRAAAERVPVLVRSGCADEAGTLCAELLARFEGDSTTDAYESLRRAQASLEPGSEG